jgi:hypothetical protein
MQKVLLSASVVKAYARQKSYAITMDHVQKPKLHIVCIFISFILFNIRNWII